MKKVFLSLLVSSSAACGAFGGTSQVKVAIAAPSPAPLDVTDVKIEAYQTLLVPMGMVLPIGGYGNDDLQVLAAGFAESAAPLRGTGEPYRVHVLVRRVVLATNNSRTVGLTCVSWALESPEGSVVTREQFYAGHFGWTLGGTKDTMHEAIVRRVLERSVRAIRGDTSAPPATEHTYSTFEDAAADLPTTLAPNGSLPFKAASTMLDHTRAPDDVDWISRVARKRS